MGSFYRAEVSELMLLYLLVILRKEFGNNKIGLYRDDGVSCFQNLSGPESEKIDKKLFKNFKQHWLNITVECHLRITNCLDVTFDLRTAKCYSSRKVNKVNNQTTHQENSCKLSVQGYLIFRVIKSD